MKKYRPKQSNKIERIIYIIEKLYCAKPMKTLDLASYFKVSRRTIERDMAIIRKHMKNFEDLRNISYNIKREDVMIKKTLLNFAKSIGQSFYEEAKKILSAKDERTLEIIPLKPKIRKEKGIYSNILNNIREAVDRSVNVKFNYLKPDDNNKKHEKIVTPCAVLYYDNYLYLYGFVDGDENKKRTFRFDRIEDISITDQVSVSTYDIKELSDVSNVWALSEYQNKIKVEFNAYDWAYDFFKNFDVLKNQKVKDKKKFAVVSGYVSNIEEIMPYLMRFIDNIEIKNKMILKEIKKRVNIFLEKNGRK